MHILCPEKGHCRRFPGKCDDYCTRDGLIGMAENLAWQLPGFLSDYLDMGNRNHRFLNLPKR